MELAQAHPMAGHLGAANTTQRIRDRFHWPGLDISQYITPKGTAWWKYAEMLGG